MSIDKKNHAFTRKWPSSYPVIPEMVKKRQTKTMNIPDGPRSRKPGDSFYDISKYGIKFLLQTRETYGKSVSFFINGKLFIGLYSPAMVNEVYTSKQHLFIKGIGFARIRKVLGEGLLTSENPRHIHDRRMMQPSFHKNRINKYINEIYELCVEHVNTWENKDTINLSPEMMGLTLKVVSQTLFGTDSTPYAESIYKNLEIGIDRAAITMLPGFSALDNSKLPWFKDFKNSAYELTTITEKIIEEKRKNNNNALDEKETEDLLSLLISLEGEEGEKFTDKELVDQSITILLSGHETTSVTLVWALTRLNSRPEILHKLQEEADNALWIKENRMPTIEEITSYPLLESVIKETLRLTPPVWIMMRQALEDMTIDGVDIPKGSNVFISPYITHRDSDNFVNPNRWLPERWLEDPELEKKLPKGSYFPFGMGARKCIGDQLALMEIRIILMYIVSKYTIDPLNTKLTIPKMKPRATLRPYGKVESLITKRNT